MKKTIDLIIDDKKIEVKPGTSILEAALEAGIKIPTLCYHPALSVDGSCRICVVEDLATAKLVVSCSTPVAAGMHISTMSDIVIQARKTILELLLEKHPNDCMCCEADGKCTLQGLAYEYGINRPAFGYLKDFGKRIEDSNPFIAFDPDKCILCSKCIRVDQEIQCSAALEFVNRGSQTRLMTPFGDDDHNKYSTCVHCGQCVEMCPTGALTYIPSRNQGREYDFDKKVRTTCAYCGVGCQLELKIKNNTVIKVGSIYKADLPNPFGETCVKGRFAYDFINHPNRLKMPMIKRDGVHVEVGWDEALAFVARKLSDIKQKSGGDSIGFLSSARCTNEENYVMQKFTRAVLGTNNIDHCARLCHASTVTGLAKAFGSGAMTNSIDEIDGSDLIFVTGSNTTETHPVIGSRIKRAVQNGTKLIVADPRSIDLAKFAHIAVNQLPGSDIALLNGMMHVIISEGLHDKEFVETRCEGFDELKATLSDYTPDIVAKITGISADNIISMARAYASAGSAAIYYSMGITQHACGTDNVTSIANLAMLTGNVGRESTGVNPLRGQNNVQGACDLGALPNVYPGYQKITDLKNRLKFEAAWGVKHLSDKVGLTVVEMFNEIENGNMSALYIAGENPVVSDPDQTHVIKALDKIEFLVVQDIFMTETAKFADVVLPVACFAEKDGTFTNTERRVQLVNKAVAAPGFARTDWEVICDIANLMGYKMSYSSAQEIMKEINSVTPIYAGITYERLQRCEGLQWPCPDPTHPGTKFLHAEKFPIGKGRFYPAPNVPPVESADQEYPYIMTTGRMLYHYHTGTMTRNSKAVDEFEPDAYVEICSADAVRLGIKQNDRVKVTSRRGVVETNARVTERVVEGQIFMPFHYAESPANRLTLSTFDPQAKIPELKITAVNLEKA